MMKLTKKKIEWIIRQKEAQESSREIAKVQHITPKTSGSALETVSGYRNNSDNRAEDGTTEEADHGAFISTKDSGSSTIPCRNMPARLRWCPAGKGNRGDFICRGITVCIRIKPSGITGFPASLWLKKKTGCHRLTNNLMKNDDGSFQIRSSPRSS